VWGSGPKDVWAVGPGDLLHWNGTAWSSVPAGAGKSLRAVWGTGPNDVWVVGGNYSGSFLHWDGTVWSALGTVDQNILAIWGSGPFDVWAAGEFGAILHH
jgi:hypothetical protein